MNLNFLSRFSSFTYLNVTQFLGAMNDNIYKMLLIFSLIQIEGTANSPTILAVTGALFVIPFLLLSSTAGTLADRFSKSQIIIATKILECFSITAGVISFAYQSKYGLYAVLILMACQSAMFGPSKYGIVPELVPKEKISKANGLLSSFTFLAIIIGTFLASFITQITGRNYVMSSLICTAFALLGLISSLCIGRTPPSGSSQKISPRFIGEIFDSLKIAKKERHLLSAILGSGYFLFFGAFVQLNTIPFAMESLHLTDVEGGYLFLLGALGIGLGSILAGKISGKSVELGLVPLGALGISFGSFMLDLFSTSLFSVTFLIIFLGMSAGLYQVPLDSYIQSTSPKKQRGRISAASNFLSFVGVLLASGFMYFIHEILKLHADKGFTLMGGLTLIIGIIFSYKYFDYASYLIARIMSRMHFRPSFYGTNNIPDKPAVYICAHTAWNDILLMVRAQNKPMRFFIESQQLHHNWVKRLYNLLKIELTPFTEQNPCDVNIIKETLDRGTSVCLFLDDPDIKQEIEKGKYVTAFQTILQETPYQIIPVLINKWEKRARVPVFQGLRKRWRVPASLFFGKISQK